MKTTSKLLTLLCAAAFVPACGGASKTSGKAMTGMAANASGPPTGKDVKLERKVSRETEKDFASAVKYFQEQAKAGWSEASCNEASDRFTVVAEGSKKMVEARFNAGLALQACGMNKPAETQYKKALKINPGHAASLSNLGEIYFKGGNEEMAKKYWTQAVSANGKIVAARNNLAWLDIREIRDGKASLASLENKIKANLSSALAVDNDNVEAYTLYGLLYMQGAKKNKSRLTLAKLLLDKGEDIDGSYAPLHNARGLLLLQQDNVPKALLSFRRAVELNAKFLEAHRNLGNIVLDFRKYDEAKVEFDIVLGLDGKDYDARIGLGYALRGLKQYDEAEASYKAAKKIDKNRPEADYNLGVLYQDFRSSATEDLNEAQSAFREATKFFKLAMAKPTATKSLKKDAKENIKTCEKNVKNLEMAIKFQE
ncbi:MAG: tetratricopeptide repeat protein [Myxococcales bacterium]|nr:tetratricopeptide repeat protein [Myxococcales bacterium]